MRYIIYHYFPLFLFTFVNVATGKFKLTNVACILFLLEGSTLAP